MGLAGTLSSRSSSGAEFRAASIVRSHRHSAGVAWPNVYNRSICDPGALIPTAAFFAQSTSGPRSISKRLPDRAHRFSLPTLGQSITMSYGRTDAVHAGGRRLACPGDHPYTVVADARPHAPRLVVPMIYAGDRPPHVATGGPGNRSGRRCWNGMAISASAADVRSATGTAARTWITSSPGRGAAAMTWTTWRRSARPTTRARRPCTTMASAGDQVACQTPQGGVLSLGAGMRTTRAAAYRFSRVLV